MKKIKKVKKLTYSKAKKQAWDAFSRYIRSRECTDGVGDLAFGNCFTCEKRYEFKQLQGGHWIPGRHNSVLFDERGCHAQCYHCNVGLKGNPVVYYDKMLEVYGKKVCEELKALDKTLKEYKVVDLVEIKDKYTQLLEELNK